MKHHLRKCLALLTSCTILSTGIAALPVTTGAASNIITNSTFDIGTSGWGTYKESGGVCSLSTENKQLALTVSNVGKVNYAVQVYYDIVPLYQNGVYRLKYDISSSIDRTVEGMIQQNGGTYQAYTWKNLTLTSTPQTIDYTFTMESETDMMAKLVFNCGTQGANLPEHTIYLDNVSLELVDDSEVDYGAVRPYEPSIITNQVGYKPSSEKIAVFRDVTDKNTFSVIHAETNEVVFTGELYGETANASADETDWYGDFSSVTEPGTYYITCGNLDDSYAFEIHDNVYSNLLDDSVRMLYLQRCGTAIEDAVFNHPVCHHTDAVIYNTNEKIDVSGGWHDAGDYGRYVVPGAKAVADLLYAYDANPKLFNDNIGIPDSGNGVPDVLDEVRYELEWMLKMQAESGGVYHKVTCENFPGYVMPQAETAQLIVTPISTTATADFCASMAMAYEFYYDIDQDFAETCLEAAKSAWAFLEANPNLIFTNPSDITTGEYGDTSDKDERYWAAAQMYRATGENEYLTVLEGMTTKTGFDWTTVGDYGNVAILTMDGIDTESTVYKNAKNAIISQANTFINATNSNPYSVAISRFNWGSNMTVSNAGIILGLAHQLTGEESYNTAAESNLNYLLGKNPLGECFVTGYGTVSPQNPHHRPSMAKGQSMKGMLVGGVNSNLEDSAAKAYLADAPIAKRYIDNAESYSTNEITIYWNSPLTYLLSLTENSETAVKKGDINFDGVVDGIDLCLARQGVLNEFFNTTAEKNAADVDQNGVVDRTDIHLIQDFLLAKITKFPVADPDSSKVPDYGTPINKSATTVADFRLGETPLFFASDGWSNGSCFDCGWYKENAVIKDNALNLSIDNDSTGKYSYSGGEYRTTNFYHYGYYETSMQAIKNDGVVSSFFTYTGPSDNNPWDEIDIEILGKDTTKVQFNYYTNGVGNHEYMYDLGFDASEGYHTYGFNWQPDYIAWYVDGKEVYRATSNIPTTPGKIMMNTWPGTGVNDWLNPYDGTTPLTARYQWVTYNEQ